MGARTFQGPFPSPSVGLQMTDDLSVQAEYSGTFSGNQSNRTAKLGLQLSF